MGGLSPSPLHDLLWCEFLVLISSCCLTVVRTTFMCSHLFLIFHTDLQECFQTSPGFLIQSLGCVQRPFSGLFSSQSPAECTDFGPGLVFVALCRCCSWVFFLKYLIVEHITCWIRGFPGKCFVERSPAVQLILSMLGLSGIRWFVESELTLEYLLRLVHFPEVCCHGDSCYGTVSFDKTGWSCSVVLDFSSTGCCLKTQEQ